MTIKRQQIISEELKETFDQLAILGHYLYFLRKDLLQSFHK
jgi:hypothetical protein